MTRWLSVENAGLTHPSLSRPARQAFWLASRTLELRLGALLQGSVHLLESAPRLLKNATDERNEDAPERLALNEERPAVSRLKFEMMLAVEDAGKHQTAEPREFLIRVRLQDGGLQRYRSPVWRLECDFEP